MLLLPMCYVSLIVRFVVVVVHVMVMTMMVVMIMPGVGLFLVSHSAYT